jgi:hypothetical protein
MTSSEDRDPHRRIRFTRRRTPRPPLWPVIVAAVALVFLILLSRYLGT